MVDPKIVVLAVALVAATSGSAHAAKRPAANPASNVHYACHDHGVRNPQL